jgi:transcriptional regulator with XRE-family HTH domain
MSNQTVKSRILPDNIREFRKSIGKNQREFADLFGVTQANVSQWENGAVSPPITMLQVIKRHYKEVNAESFFTEPFPGKKYDENPGQIEIDAVKNEVHTLRSNNKSLLKDISEKRDEIIRLREQIDVLNKVVKQTFK